MSWTHYHFLLKLKEKKAGLCYMNEAVDSGFPSGNWNIKAIPCIMNKLLFYEITLAFYETMIYKYQLYLFNLWVYKNSCPFLGLILFFRRFTRPRAFATKMSLLPHSESTRPALPRHEKLIPSRLSGSCCFTENMV